MAGLIPDRPRDYRMSRSVSVRDAVSCSVPFSPPRAPRKRRARACEWRGSLRPASLATIPLEMHVSEL
jgi:hypothetical protein